MLDVAKTDGKQGPLAPAVGAPRATPRARPSEAPRGRAMLDPSPSSSVSRDLAGVLQSRGHPRLCRIAWRSGVPEGHPKIAQHFSVLGRLRLSIFRVPEGRLRPRATRVQSSLRDLHQKARHLDPALKVLGYFHLARPGPVQSRLTETGMHAPVS
jgi:hypothetical protein